MKIRTNRRRRARELTIPAGGEAADPSRGTSHPTRDQVALADELQRRVDSSDANADDLLTLALLRLEPFHDGFGAAQLLESVRGTAGEVATASVWYAYAAVHFLFDASTLQKAFDLLTHSAGPTRELESARELMMAEVIHRLDANADDDIAGHIQRSIELAPEWVSNHQLLAWFMERRGEHELALQHLRTALANTIPPDPAWSLLQAEFECNITARTSFNVDRRISDVIRRLAPAERGEKRT